MPEVIKERKRRVKRRRPPAIETLDHSPWLQQDSKKAMLRYLKKHGHLELYISENAERGMRKHAVEYKKKGLEVMGFLVGDRYLYKGKIFSAVHDLVSTDLDSTALSVRFKRSGFEKMFKNLDNFGDYLIVGWYHSHLGLGCFLSETDIATQKRMFNRRWQTAVVLDPEKKRIEAFSLKEGKPVTKHFAVFREGIGDWSPHAKIGTLRLHPNVNDQFPYQRI